MPSKKTPKKSPKTDPKIESPFVSYEKLLEAIEVVKKLSDLRKSEENNKRPLIEDHSNEFIKLQINLKKIPYNKTTFIHLISLPNHWRHETDTYETCLIVKDLNKTPLTDRELDLDQTKSHYKELLTKDNSDQLVTEILPMRELRNEYKLFEAKQRLSKAFDVFLCDRKLLHNKFDYLSRFLGKTFWISEKKVPIPIDLTNTDLKKVIDNQLNQTSLYFSGKGDTISIDFGLLRQSIDKLGVNLLTITKWLSQKYGNNIRSLSLKTDKSIGITFFMDCGFVSDIIMSKNIGDNKPIEDDFSHFYNSNVQVFKDGDVKVVKKAPQDIDKTEAIDPIEAQWLSMNKKRRNGKRKKQFRVNPIKPFKKRQNNNKTVESID